MRVGVIKSGMKFATSVAAFELHVSCQIISGRVQIARPLQGPSGPPAPPRAPEGAQIPRQKKETGIGPSAASVVPPHTNLQPEYRFTCLSLGAKVTKN